LAQACKQVWSGNMPDLPLIVGFSRCCYRAVFFLHVIHLHEAAALPTGHPVRVALEVLPRQAIVRRGELAREPPLRAPLSKDDDLPKESEAQHNDGGVPVRSSWWMDPGGEPTFLKQDPDEGIGEDPEGAPDGGDSDVGTPDDAAAHAAGDGAGDDDGVILTSNASGNITAGNATAGNATAGNSTAGSATAGNATAGNATTAVATTTAAAAATTATMATTTTTTTTVGAPTVDVGPPEPAEGAPAGTGTDESVSGPLASAGTGARKRRRAITDPPVEVTTTPKLRVIPYPKTHVATISRTSHHDTISNTNNVVSWSNTTGNSSETTATKDLDNGPMEGDGSYAPSAAGDLFNSSGSNISAAAKSIAAVRAATVTAAPIAAVAAAPGNKSVAAIAAAPAAATTAAR